MEIRTAEETDLAVMAELAAVLQADPTQANAYLAVEASGIQAELEEIDWQPVSAVAIDDDRLAGWLVADVDPELGRVYWLGPFVSAHDWNDVASRLYDACAALVPAGMTQEEMAIDSRFTRYETWAAARGFVAGVGSLALVMQDEPPTSDHEYRHVRDDDLSTIGALHEELFPGTHTTGRQLVEDRDDSHVWLVAEVDGALAGYVAFEVQPDGSGYLDFLGVAPEFRRRGVAADLGRAAVAMLVQRGAAPIHLTVRVDNHAARALYASLGFTEERVITPLRKGFALA